jgi:tetratricopeptide (TPR) repeat protein
MNKSKMLLTGSMIKKALGSIYERLKNDFDPHKNERRETDRIGRRVFKKKIDVCVACGGNRDKGFRLEYAHIVPLEECGETKEENIVPLCERQGKQQENRGCHKLFDEGYASITEVERAKLEWKNSNSKYLLRKQMVKRYKKHQEQSASITSDSKNKIQALLTKGATVQAITEAKRLLKQTNDKDTIFELKLKIINIERRRSALGALERSAKYFDQLEQENGVPKKFASWFYYEGGYIKLLSGHHNTALKYFQQSLNAIDKTKKNWQAQFVAATSLIVQSKIALMGSKAPFSTLRSQLIKAKTIASQAKEIHGTRWISNCLWHLVTVDILRGNIQCAQESFEEAQNHWHTMTVLEGWDKRSRLTILAITGELLAEKAKNKTNAREALKYLTRALVLLVGARPHFPERGRDLLFATARMLHLIGWSRKAGQVDNVASRIREGSSWRFPYRDT